MSIERDWWHSYATYEKDEIICDVINNNQPCTQTKITKELNLHQMIIQRELERMVAEGKIKRRYLGALYLYKVINNGKDEREIETAGDTEGDRRMCFLRDEMERTPKTS